MKKLKIVDSHEKESISAFIECPALDRRDS